MSFLWNSSSNSNSNTLSGKKTASGPSSTSSAFTKKNDEDIVAANDSDKSADKLDKSSVKSSDKVADKVADKKSDDKVVDKKSDDKKFDDKKSDDKKSDDKAVDKKFDDKAAVGKKFDEKAADKKSDDKKSDDKFAKPADKFAAKECNADGVCNVSKNKFEAKSPAASKPEIATCPLYATSDSATTVPSSKDAAAIKEFKAKYAQLLTEFEAFVAKFKVITSQFEDVTIL